MCNLQKRLIRAAFWLLLQAMFMSDWKQTAQRLKLQKRLLTIDKRKITRWNIYRDNNFIHADKYGGEGNPRGVPGVSFWRKMNNFRGNQRSCSSETSILMVLRSTDDIILRKKVLRICFLRDLGSGHPPGATYCHISLLGQKLDRWIFVTENLLYATSNIQT